jgi:hypothetical protein
MTDSTGAGLVLFEEEAHFGQGEKGVVDLELVFAGIFRNFDDVAYAVTVAAKLGDQEIGV